MSDESTAPETTTPDVQEAPAPETPVNDTLPEWVRDKLTKANNEAAKYRTKAKEAAEQAQFEAEEKFSSQIKELTDTKASLDAELHKSRTDNTKLRAALAVGIPGESAAEFAALLQGETEDEIHAHAEKVKTLFGQKPTGFVDKSQGLGGGRSANPADAFGAFILNNLSK